MAVISFDKIFIWRCVFFVCWFSHCRHLHWYHMHLVLGHQVRQVRFGASRIGRDQQSCTVTKLRFWDKITQYTITSRPDMTFVVDWALKTNYLSICNALLSGVPAASIHCLQRMSNSVTRLVLRKKKTDHIPPLLRSLHWLSVSQRIQYQIILYTLCYKWFMNPPILLSTTCTAHLYSPPRKVAGEFQK